MNTLDHITTEYDAEFAKIPDLKWDPAVGKNYRDTRIMIMGTSTPASDEERDTTRHIVFHDGEHRAFKATSQMFLEEVGIEHNDQNKNLFWSSVAFNNFIQGSVSAQVPTDDEVASMAPASVSAYKATVEVIKPDLVIFWSNSLHKHQLGGENTKECEKVGNFTPRVALENPPSVGIYHPGMQPHFSRSAWMEFLKTCEHSKPHVERFLAYLKESASR